MNIQETIVNRTTLTLYRAMFELLEGHSFEAITVNDICQHAIVSRSTFYAYFADKYELVTFCLRRERDALKLAKDASLEGKILALLEAIAAKRQIYRNLLIAQSNHELNQLVLTQLSQTISQSLKPAGTLAEEVTVAAIFNAYGIVGTIVWWIETNSAIEVATLAAYLFQEVSSRVQRT